MCVLCIPAFLHLYKLYGVCNHIFTISAVGGDSDPASSALIESESAESTKYLVVLRYLLLIDSKDCLAVAVADGDWCVSRATNVVAMGHAYFVNPILGESWPVSY